MWCWDLSSIYIILTWLLPCPLLWSFYVCRLKSSARSERCSENLEKKTRKFKYITPILASLHQLPVQVRADIKVLLLSYKALQRPAPHYLSELLKHFTPVLGLEAGPLVIPHVNKKITVPLISIPTSRSMFSGIFLIKAENPSLFTSLQPINLSCVHCLLNIFNSS